MFDNQVDVRRPDEIAATGKVAPHALNIPVEELSQAFTLNSAAFKSKYGFDKPDPSKVTIVYTCRSGKRSDNACQISAALGYKCVNYLGGANEWFA